MTSTTTATAMAIASEGEREREKEKEEVIEFEQNSSDMGMSKIRSKEEKKNTLPRFSLYQFNGLDKTSSTNELFQRYFSLVLHLFLGLRCVNCVCATFSYKLKHKTNKKRTGGGRYAVLHRIAYVENKVL